MFWQQPLTAVSFWSREVASSWISLLCSRVILCACVLYLTGWRHWIIVYQCLLSHVLFIEKLFCCLLSSCYLLTSHGVTLTGCCVYSDGLPINNVWGLCQAALLYRIPFESLWGDLHHPALLWTFLPKSCFTHFCCVPCSFLGFKTQGFFHNQIKTYLMCFPSIICHDCNNTDVFLLLYQSQEWISAVFLLFVLGLILISLPNMIMIGFFKDASNDISRGV